MDTFAPGSAAVSPWAMPVYRLDGISGPCTTRGPVGRPVLPVLLVPDEGCSLPQPATATQNATNVTRPKCPDISGLPGRIGGLYVTPGTPSGSPPAFKSGRSIEV